MKITKLISIGKHFGLLCFFLFAYLSPLHTQNSSKTYLNVEGEPCLDRIFSNVSFFKVYEPRGWEFKEIQWRMEFYEEESTKVMKSGNSFQKNFNVHYNHPGEYKMYYRVFYLDKHTGYIIHNDLEYRKRIYVRKYCPRD